MGLYGVSEAAGVEEAAGHAKTGRAVFFSFSGGFVVDRVAGGFLAGLFVGFGWAGVVEGADACSGVFDVFERGGWRVGQAVAGEDFVAPRVVALLAHHAWLPPPP